MTLHRILRNRKASAHLAVLRSLSYLAQYLHLTLGEGFVTQMLRESLRHRAGYVLPTRVDRTNGRNQLVVVTMFQQIAERAPFEGPLNLAIASVGREHHNTSLRRLAKNRTEHI